LHKPDVIELRPDLFTLDNSGFCDILMLPVALGITPNQLFL